MLRRRGRLLGTVARTAVVAGTATATAGAVSRHQQNKAAEKQAAAEQEAAEQEAAEQAPPSRRLPIRPRRRRPCTRPRHHPRAAAGTCCRGRRPGRTDPAARRIARCGSAVRGRVRRGQGQTAGHVRRAAPDRRPCCWRLPRRPGLIGGCHPSCRAVIRHRPSTPSIRNASAFTRSARRNATLTSATPSAGSHTRTVSRCGSANCGAAARSPSPA